MGEGKQCRPCGFCADGPASCDFGDEAVYSPPSVDRIWGIWGIFLMYPKPKFDLLKGDSRAQGLGFRVLLHSLIPEESVQANTLHLNIPMKNTGLECQGDLVS